MSATGCDTPPPDACDDGFVANAACIRYSEYATVRIEPTTRPMAVNTPGMPRRGSASSTASSAASLATNPNSGGTPAIDAAARPAMMNICGRRSPRPDNCRTSRVPVVWSMAPTIMNRVALNIAWPRVRARAASIAARVPMDVTVMMKPSCDTVP